MTKKELMRLVEVNAYGVYCSTLIENPCPYVKKIHDRIKNPQAGDMVLETSSISYPAHDGNRLGQLLRVVNEPIFSERELKKFQDAGEDTEDEFFHKTERVVYIQTLDGREFRWRNAAFIVVSESTKAFSMPE